MAVLTAKDINERLLPLQQLGFGHPDQPHLVGALGQGRPLVLPHHFLGAPQAAHPLHARELAAGRGPTSLYATGGFQPRLPPTSLQGLGSSTRCSLPRSSRRLPTAVTHCRSPTCHVPASMPGTIMCKVRRLSMPSPGSCIDIRTL